MSTQSEALLGIVIAYIDTPEAERIVRDHELWGNPVICTPTVHAMAQAEADPGELAMLDQMVRDGHVVVADDPAAERVRLAALRPGYENRETRRARRKGDKRK